MKNIDKIRQRNFVWLRGKKLCVHLLQVHCLEGELGARLRNIIQLYSVRHAAAEPVVAIMRRVDEQLRFLHQLHGAIGIDGLGRADKLLGLKHGR